MIDALIGGRLRGAPRFKTASNGSPYVSFTLAASDRNSTSLLCSCISFSERVVDALQPLTDGDSVTVSGEASPKQWQGSDGAQRLGLDVLVHQVMTAYHAGRKRRAGTNGDPGAGHE